MCVCVCVCVLKKKENYGGALVENCVCVLMNIKSDDMNYIIKVAKRMTFILDYLKL